MTCELGLTLWITSGIRPANSRDMIEILIQYDMFTMNVLQIITVYEFIILVCDGKNTLKQSDNCMASFPFSLSSFDKKEALLEWYQNIYLAVIISCKTHTHCILTMDTLYVYELHLCIW